MVSSALFPEQVESALHEVGVDADEIPGLGGWRTSDDVVVVRVPFPGGN
jgi:hypothetical protein